MKKLLFFFSISLTLLSSCQRSFDEKCQLEALKETQTKCPREITPGITCDSIHYDTTIRSMIYYYTMSDEYDNPSTIAAGKDKFNDALRNQIINSIELKKYKENGVDFRYVYFSKSTHNVLLDLHYTPKDYQ